MGFEIHKNMVRSIGDVSVRLLVPVCYHARSGKGFGGGGGGGYSFGRKNIAVGAGVDPTSLTGYPSTMRVSPRGQSRTTPERHATDVRYFSEFTASPNTPHDARRVRFCLSTLFDRINLPCSY